MNRFTTWINETHSVPLFQQKRSKGHIDKPVWRLAAKGLLQSIKKPIGYRNVSYFVQFLSFPRSGHSLIGSLIDAHQDAIISHELDVMGLIKKGMSQRMIFGLIEDNSEDFTNNGRFWNGFSYQAKDLPHGASDTLRVIGDKKGDWAVRWYASDDELIKKLDKTIKCTPRWILVTRNPMDNIATLSLRKNRTYDELRIQNEKRSLFSTALKKHQGEGKVAAYVRDDMIEDYEILCLTISRMKNEIAADNMLHIVYEDFCETPKTELTRICQFLDISTNRKYLDNCSAMVKSSLNKSRNRIEWTNDQISKVRQITESHDFLHRYLNDIYIDG